jgi:hypothetical protein
MPNHTSTRLEITGDIAEINRFIALADKPNCHFDFNSVVPMPEDLVGSVSPSRIVPQSTIDAEKAKWDALSEAEKEKQTKFWGAKGKYSFGITQEQSNELKAKYGADNWYDWSIKNWGTKWGAYDVSNWEVSGNKANVHYQTAWSPATEFFLTASKQFTTLSFTHYYADEGGGFLGWETIKNGKTVKTVEIDWDSDEGISLRQELGCYSYDEDYEDDAGEEN